jgi:hypothetical protein
MAMDPKKREKVLAMLREHYDNNIEPLLKLRDAREARRNEERKNNTD